MKRVFVALVFVILLTSFSSADIIFQKQPGELYNLEDTINLPIKITTLTGLQDTLHIFVICNGQQEEFYRNDIDLNPGEEKLLEPTLRLSKLRVGGLIGGCRIKAEIGEDYQLTNEFWVSNIINIEIYNDRVDFKPQETILLEGLATKENEELVDGIIEVSTGDSNTTSDIKIIDTVNDGYFSVNVTFPKEMPAGEHTFSINIYEKDKNNEITNSGASTYKVTIEQIPTNLEINIDSTEIKPGTSITLDVILHDQTGNNIPHPSIVTIKNHENDIKTQLELQTGEKFEYKIPYNEPPKEWTIVAVSNKMTSQSVFKILENQKADITLINKTLTITNIGNVPYNKTLLVKIGEDSVTIDVFLEIDESKEYTISAPDGEYTINILENGEKQLSAEGIFLTGSTIDIREVGSGIYTLVRYPFIWIFVIGVFGFAAFMVIKKGYQRSFIGTIRIGKNKEGSSSTPLRKTSLIRSSNKAELSLSIKGDKQPVSLICLKIKNLRELESKKTQAEQTLQHIVDLAESHKAITYENQESLFFIFAPVKTKTFDNEKTSLELAEKAKEILAHHNRMMKDKIHFGIAINNGSIVAKSEKDSIKFMSMGTLITISKKLSGVAQNEILISESAHDKLRSNLKTEKKMIGELTAFSIKEVKSVKEETEKFIKNFVKKLEGEKKKE